MFEMINEEKPDSETRKLFVVKVAAFIVVLAAAAGVLYFFAFGSMK